MSTSHQRFWPERASASDLDAYFRLVTAASLVDWPDNPLPSYDSVITRLQTTFMARSSSCFWTAHRAGSLAGIVRFMLPAGENDSLVIAETRVHPDHRRTGVGSGLLRTSLPHLLEAGRTTVCGNVPEGAAGDGWTARLGLRVTARQILQRLDLPSARPPRLSPRAGYALADWHGEAPDALLASYSQARNAIHDRPSGRSSYQAPEWTPALVRGVEQDLWCRGVSQRVVAAIHIRTGSVAALTVVEFHPHRSDIAFQKDTVVAAGHRGQGLGLYVKTAMLDLLAAERPMVSHVDTAMSSLNTHMIDINHEIGFTTTRVLLDVEADAHELAAGLVSTP